MGLMINTFWVLRVEINVELQRKADGGGWFVKVRTVYQETSSEGKSELYVFLPIFRQFWKAQDVKGGEAVHQHAENT